MPRRPLRSVLVAGLVLAAFPPAVQAREAEVLVDRAPVGDAPDFGDRVVEGSGSSARAAQAAPVYTAADGSRIHVTLSPSYAANTAVAQSYADFVAGLPHGAEIDQLTMYVGTAAEVQSGCGAAGDANILACYLPDRELMIVPGEDPPTGSGVTTSYVVAHEYGHHVANHRSNAPFAALDYGPKRWASEANVCSGTLAGRLAPGDEGTNYAANPGEAWAETLAQLKYPATAWGFTNLLRPDAAGRAAARLDVTQPWTERRTTTFTGSLAPGDEQDRHTIRLKLDGALSFRLSGPSRSNFDLTVRSNGTSQGATTARGSKDRLSYRAACVASPESVAVTVKRRSGAGRYTLRVTYAG